jgi:hypothetical protein
MMIRRNKNNTNDGHLAGKNNTYFKDIRSFSIIVFTVSLMTAATINTQIGMKKIADLLVFFGLGYLIVGIFDQPIRMRK